MNLTGAGENRHTYPATSQPTEPATASPSVDDSADRLLLDSELREALARAKNAEAALRQEKECAEQYLDIAGVMLAIVDADERIVLVNRKGLETLAYEEGELTGRNWFDTLVPRNSRKSKRRAFGRLVAGGKDGLLDGEDSLVAKNGDLRMIAFHNAAVRGPDGAITGVLFTGEDVTELQKTRELLQHSQLLASLGEMTAGIAHEVNNPLGSILLYSELMMSANTPPGFRKDLQVIHEEARRATKVVTDLLACSRREKSQVRRLDLLTILNKMLDMRRYTERVQNITVTVRYQDRPLHVRGDASQLMQLFINLMLNAEQALKEVGGGDIIITAWKEGKWAKVSISDNGTGIPPANLGQVFYPFFTTKRKQDGVGLGLSTCYGIVTDHNGLIHAENNPMGGATFTVELPLARALRQIRRRQTQSDR